MCVLLQNIGKRERELKLPCLVKKERKSQSERKAKCPFHKMYQCFFCGNRFVITW